MDASAFWRKINKNGPIHPVLKTRCWLWTACKDSKGYGNLYFEGNWRKAHRVAWFLLHGKWPSRFLLHHCDTPLCVRDTHLFEGTQQDNVTDMLKKGRGACTRFKGSANPNAKLTEAQVLYIYESKKAEGILRRITGASSFTISAIRTGKQWISVTQKGAQ